MEFVVNTGARLCRRAGLHLPVAGKLRGGAPGGRQGPWRGGGAGARKERFPGVCGWPACYRYHLCTECEPWSKVSLPDPSITVRVRVLTVDEFGSRV